MNGELYSKVFVTFTELGIVPLVLFGIFLYGFAYLPKWAQDTSSRSAVNSARAVGLLIFVLFIITRRGKGDAFVAESMVGSLNWWLGALGLVAGGTFSWVITRYRDTRALSAAVLLIVASMPAAIYSYFFVHDVQNYILLLAVTLPIGFLLQAIFFPARPEAEFDIRWAGGLKTAFGLSENESRVAQYLLKTSQRGAGISYHSIVEISTAAELEIGDVSQSIAGLVGRAYLEHRGGTGEHSQSVRITPFLFWDLDFYVHGWNPREDAKTIAATLVESPVAGYGQLRTKEFASKQGWPLRRLNPALTYLCVSAIVRASTEVESDVVAPQIFETKSTKAFLNGEFGSEARGRRKRSPHNTVGRADG